MDTGVEILRSDGSILHVDPVDVFELAEDGLVDRESTLVDDERAVRLAALPLLKWAFIAADLHPGCYASYEVEGDSPVTR
jgi:hypothetical protein